MSQSDTAGCDTPIALANSSWVVSVLASQARSRSIPRIIGDSYASSIGHTYAIASQNRNVSKSTTRTFWERVQEAMVDAGMKPTQTAAAKLIGVSQPSVAEWNDLDGYPTIANAVALGRKLRVCVEWLLTERGPKRPLPEDPTAQRLWDIWPRLDDVTKGELIGKAQERLQRGDDEHLGGTKEA